MLRLRNDVERSKLAHFVYPHTGSGPWFCRRCGMPSRTHQRGRAIAPEQPSLGPDCHDRRAWQRCCGLAIHHRRTRPRRQLPGGRHIGRCEPCRHGGAYPSRGAAPLCAGGRVDGRMVALEVMRAAPERVSHVDLFDTNIRPDGTEQAQRPRAANTAMLAVAGPAVASMVHASASDQIREDLMAMILLWALRFTLSRTKRLSREATFARSCRRSQRRRLSRSARSLILTWKSGRG